MIVKQRHKIVYKLELNMLDAINLHVVLMDFIESENNFAGENLDKRVIQGHKDFAKKLVKLLDMNWFIAIILTMETLNKHSLSSLEANMEKEIRALLNDGKSARYVLASLGSKYNSAKLHQALITIVKARKFGQEY